MKKRRKNQAGQNPPAAPPAAAPEPVPASEALSAPPGAEAESGPTTLAVDDAFVNELPAGDPPLGDSMDDLLAELLADDPESLSEVAEPEPPTPAAPEIEDVPVPAVVTSPVREPEAGAVQEIEILAAPAAEPVAEIVDFDPENIEEPAEFLLDAIEAESPSPEPRPVEEQPEATQFSIIASQATDEMLAEMLASADELMEEPEPAAEDPRIATPLPPQPPFEVVIQAIAVEIRKAPEVSLTPDAPAVTHRQYSQLDDYVVFSLCGADYAVPVKDVSEIGRIPSIARVPNVPEFVRGLTNLRGEMVPVLNLQLLLGLHEAQTSARGRVLFLQPRERIASTALMVDEVKGIQRIQSQQLEQVTGLVDDKVTSVLRGVHGRGDRLLNILDLDQLFQLQEIRKLESQ